MISLFCLRTTVLGLGLSSEAPGYRLIDRCDYRNNSAAQAVWRSINGSAQPVTVNAGGRNALGIPCRFKGTKAERASVERKVQLDLTRCQGLQFQFRCVDPSPVSKFNFYLRSGRGWYAASFATDNASGWNTVIIDKGVMQKEGKPGGWDEIDAIRISAWKAEEADTEFLVADLGLWGEDAPIMIVRGDWYVRKCPGEAASVAARVATMAQNLRAIDASYNVCGDAELSSELLKGKRVVILPQNSEMPDAAVRVLGSFLRSGGKLISFYVLPAELRPVVGIKQGEHIRQAYTGAFASIRSSGGAILGLPELVCQRSWSVFQSRPADAKSSVAACWYSDRGENTGEPALIVSPNCIHMTHVLLSDDPAGKKALMLALTGHFMQEVWKRAARAALDRVGMVGPYQDRDELARALGAGAKADAGLRDTLEKGEQLRGRAEGQFGVGRFIESFQTAEEAQKLMIRAYCMAQSPREGERRLAWCHDPFGVTGMDWDKAIGILAGGGFTDIIVNMCWAASADYDSKVLPVAPEARSRGDQIRQCLAACRKHGVRLHVWRVCWNMGWSAPTDFAGKMKREGRTQVHFDGGAKDDWLCPSHPENQKLEIAAMVEIAKNYEVDGIHFDYIRYPGSTCCFCQGCRGRFESMIQRKVKNWPRAVKSDAAMGKKWLDFRRQNINSVVAAVSSSARVARPGISISAAVFSDWAVVRDDIGQDWKLWCEAGYVDFVCPMDYTANNREFETMVGKQLGWAGKTPCYPGIGLSLWPPADRMSRLVDQVNITRRLGTGGFVFFNFNRSEAEEILPLCGMGLTRKTSVPPASAR